LSSHPPQQEIILKGIVLAAVLSAMPIVASADRISTMNRAERCAYSTRLQVLAAYYYGKGTSRAEVKIHWHGDETQNEIDFVNEALDTGYARIAREHEAGRRDLPLELLGDRVFEECMRGEES
jgi:hypothetical protein